MVTAELNIKQLRISKFGTQSKFAKHIGVNRSEISQWENGKRFPSKVNLIKLEKTFDKPHSFLFAEAAMPQSFQTKGT